MALAFEAKRLKPLSKRQDVKNTSFLHCNLASKKNLSTPFLASLLKLKGWRLFQSVKMWKIHPFYSHIGIQDFLIEIFSRVKLKREKRQFRFLKGNDNNGKSSWKMMVRFWNCISRVSKFVVIWVLELQNIDFPTIIEGSSFFGFHVKIRKFDTFSILFLGQRLF